MKKQTELPKTITLETITDHISIGDIPEFRDSLRLLMDRGFLYCGESGGNAEPAWCAFQAVDQLLEIIYCKGTYYYSQSRWIDFRIANGNYGSPKTSEWISSVYYCFSDGLIGFLTNKGKLWYLE